MARDDSLYTGLSEKAREECLRRMARTLTTMPRHKKTREYVKSLTGERETPAQLRARARAAAEKIVDHAQATSNAGRPIILRVRKSRVSPFAREQERRHPTKHCRRKSRHQPHFVAESPRPLRDLEEMRRVRQMLHAAQGGLCAICGHPLDADPLRASIDHVIPHALGGKGRVGNYVASHGECNGNKTNDAPTGCEMIWLLMVNAKLGAMPIVF